MTVMTRIDVATDYVLEPEEVKTDDRLGKVKR
jgi:hypothetical protein